MFRAFRQWLGYKGERTRGLIRRVNSGGSRKASVERRRVPVVNIEHEFDSCENRKDRFYKQRCNCIETSVP
ncbi:hypothetical protein Hanom_Chr15g01403061 [Helianthus anomalus]